MSDNINPFDLGFETFQNAVRYNLPEPKCPFPDGSDDASDWHAGGYAGIEALTKVDINAGSQVNSGGWFRFFSSVAITLRDKWPQAFLALMSIVVILTLGSDLSLVEKSFLILVGLHSTAKLLTYFFNLLFRD